MTAENQKNVFDVKAALQQVADEVAGVIQNVRDAGGDALKKGTLDPAEKSIALVRKLNEFLKKVLVLRDEWLLLGKELEYAHVGVSDGTPADTENGVTVKTPPASQKQEQSGNFPYPVGKLVRVAFPQLFKRKLVNAGDVAYLLSGKASADFKTRGYPIIRVYIGDDDPGLYSCDHRRYYKMEPMVLGTKKYHLSSQFFPESREPVLKWLFAHGLKKSELIDLCENM